MTAYGAHPRSVLFVITSLYRAGAQTQLLALAKGLVSRGWRVDVAHLIDDHSLTHDLRSVGCRIECLGMKRGVADPRAILRLASIVRKSRPQIVHSHMIHANILARATRVVVRMPALITTSHNTMECPRWLDIVGRALFPMTDMHTCVSRAGVDYTIRRGAAPRSRVAYLPNGLDVGMFARDAVSRGEMRAQLDVRDSFVWLTIGRFEAQKAHHLLLTAFAQLVRERQDAELVLVGAGPLESVYREAIAALGISSKTRILGPRKDIPELLNAADAFVMSSIEEGLPMVLLEAGASELPIVATDAGGSREAVVEGASGVIVPPGDARALFRAMRDMTALSPDRLHAMGGEGRGHVCKNYSIETVLDRWESLYRSLSEGRRGSSGDWFTGM